MGYIYVCEYFKGSQYIDANWSLIIEDLYSLELDFIDTCVTSVFSFFVLDL